MQEPMVQGKRYSVLGAARSGRAVAALLKRHGAEVFVSDRAPADRMAGARRELEALGIACEFGTNSDRVLEADALVLSPGVPSDAPPVRAALGRGLMVVSEVEAASWFCRAPVVAITGTNGKTTTTTLTGRIFEDAGEPTVVAGNIGAAFSLTADAVPSGGKVVLEISSFQLDYCITFRPRVAVLLNITPDHLDRYEHSFEKYSESKSRIFARQGPEDLLIYNADDPETVRQIGKAAPGGPRLLPFSAAQAMDNGAFTEGGRLIAVREGRRHDIMGTSEIGIRGTHNLYNAMASALAALSLGVPAESVRATLKAFQGVEHRLEFVRERNGVRFVNDSKATNVDSVWYALQSFDEPIVLMLGGRDKGNDYGRLLEPVRRNVRAIVAIGESADKVVTAFTGVVPVSTAANMEEAVRATAALARAGDIVLLSPACASFDWFDNYEHRGQVFKQLVRAL